MTAYTIPSVDQELSTLTDAFSKVEESIKSILKTLVTVTTEKCNEPNVKVLKRDEVLYLVNYLLSCNMEQRHFNTLVDMIKGKYENFRVTINAPTGYTYLYPGAALVIIRDAMNEPDLVNQAMELADSQKVQSDKSRFSKVQGLINTHFDGGVEDEDIFEIPGSAE